MAIRRKGWTGLHEVQSLSKQTKEGSQSEVFIEQSGTHHGGLTLPAAYPCTAHGNH